MAEVQKKVCLIVIDGWGISENKEGTNCFHFKQNKDCVWTDDVHCILSL